MTYQLTKLVDYLATICLDTNIEVLLRKKADIVQEYLYDVIAQFNSLYSINEAYGIFLDYVGYRLGIFERPSLPANLLNKASIFGLNPFGILPFGDITESARLPIDDDDFRRFLKVRARSLIADCTIENMVEDYKLFFDAVDDQLILVDEGDMTLDLTIITSKSLELVQSVEEAGMFYKPAGVLLKTAYNPQEFGAIFGRDPFGVKPFYSF